MLMPVFECRMSNDGMSKCRNVEMDGAISFDR